MPKMKTNKAAKKRFKVTAKGKVKRRSSFVSHLLSGRTTKRKRKLRRGCMVSAAEMRNVKRLLGKG